MTEETITISRKEYEELNKKSEEKSMNKLFSLLSIAVECYQERRRRFRCCDPMNKSSGLSLLMVLFHRTT